MDRKTTRARMKTGLVEWFTGYFGDMDADWCDFLLSIEGKEVTLIFTGDDAFELNDDNYWLPNETWEEVTP